MRNKKDRTGDGADSGDPVHCRAHRHAGQQQIGGPRRGRGRGRELRVPNYRDRFSGRPDQITGLTFPTTL